MTETEKPVILAVDAMGGDKGFPVVLEAILLFLRKNPHVQFLLFGDEACLQGEIARKGLTKAETAHLFVHHAPLSIGMHEKPSQALLRGRHDSSMAMAIRAVQKGHAHAVVSGGNTGALMAFSKVILKTHTGIERPAIAAVWPTTSPDKHTVVLDLGATIGSNAKQLVQFAIMGITYARVRFHLTHPTFGLLNIGQEDIKGTEDLKEAFRVLQQLDLAAEFKGFVEGNNIGHNVVDVVVTDGFTGNIAIKVAEGTAKQCFDTLRQEMTSSRMAKIGFFFARKAFSSFRRRVDPAKLNGGVFLGLQGLVVKSHGSSSAYAYMHALQVAHLLASGNLLSKVHAAFKNIEDLDLMKASRETESG